jgi:hypothetical protein
MAAAGGAVAAAAAAKTRLIREEEEEMTPYSSDDLHDWEFKIIRAYTGVFKKPENLQKVLEEESQAGWGIIDGATTNPSLIAKEGKDFKKTILEICKLVKGPVSAETVSLDAPASPRRP